MTVRQVEHRLSDTQRLLQELRIAAHSDGASPRSFATLLRKAAETRAWEAEFATFRSFMEADEPQGLGFDAETFMNIAELGDVEDLARGLLYGEIEALAEHGEIGRGRVRDGTTISNDNSAEVTVARLKRDDPEMADRVVRGEISAYAAAREKGWRKPRIVVSSPERVAQSLRKHMAPGDLARLAELLTTPTRDEAT